MKRISIIGGGRWSRVIADTLLNLRNITFSISMHSPSGMESLESWVSLNDQRKKIKLLKDLTFDKENLNTDAAIVVNRASDHYSTAVSMLDARIPVLVEKPIALTGDGVDKLTTLAKKNRTFLYASNVFLFQEEFVNFKERVQNSKTVKKIKLFWTDPVREIRYGESKTYDESLNIVDDVISHVLPMIQSLHEAAMMLKDIDVKLGGASVDILLVTENAEVVIHLAREAEKRQRSIFVETEHETFYFDFATEPATLTVQLGEKCETLKLPQKTRPMRSMLQMFLDNVVNGSIDPRMSPALAANAMHLADEIRPLYLELQEQWLNGNHLKEMGDGKLYAMRERGLA